MQSVYVTFDRLDPNNGAGLVCLHETRALQSVSQCHVIEQKDIHGIKEYGFNPFIADYFAARAYTGPEGIDILHLSCSPGLALLDRIRPKHFVVNCPAHDLKTSIAEHERYFGKGSYKLIHNTDEYLHEKLLQHAHYADAVITPSFSSAKWIEENIKPKRIQIISHGCSIPDTFSPFPSDFRAGYLGAFGPDKSLHLLLLAWKYFEGKGKMVFGGNCQDGVRWLSQQLNIPLTTDRYELTGWVNNVSDFYNNISIYCQVSRSEGFGIETVEAMAHGRPVIVSAGAGSADAVTDGVDGFVVPAGDWQPILDKLNYFVSNPDKIAEMGKAAREKAKTLSWDKIENKYVEFYKSILS
jgi:glycosyltransferase involved in cell wall biosynthesis